MCDCYYQKCEFCDEEIPVHIADFDYPESDVKAYCRNHLPKSNATIFRNVEMVKTGEYYDNEYCNQVGWCCALSLQNGKIEPESVGVVPNNMAESESEILKSEKI